MFLFGNTVTFDGQAPFVKGHDVGVGGKVDYAQVDEELSDLQRSDGLLPRAWDPEAAHSIVGVHDDVNKEVQSDDDP